MSLSDVKKMAGQSIKLIDKNKKAYFDYFIDDTVEAGIVLSGNEVKSIKLQNASLKDSFCKLEKGELWLKNMFVAPYQKGSVFNSEERRDRKLLLHRAELNKLEGKVRQKGITLVPTKLYFKGNRVKVEIGLCRGKKLYDKRESAKEKDIRRDVQRQIKESGV